MSEAKDPDELRAEIERDRQALGETVEALAAKADVKTQVQDKVEEQKVQFRQKQHEAQEKLGPAIEQLGPAIEQLRPVIEKLRPALEQLRPKLDPAVQQARERPAAAAGALLVLLWLLRRIRK